MALTFATMVLVSPRAASALALDPFLSPSPEYLDSPAVISMTNDSFGPGPVREWDDMDSFGLRFSAPVGRARIMAAMSGLTDRTDSESLASRLDEISLGAELSLFAKPPFLLVVGGGLDATGNLGGIFVQKVFHASTDVGRPIPTSYSDGLAVAPLASFKLLICSDAQLSPYLVAAGRATLLSRGSLIAVAGVRYEKPGALLALGGGWRLSGGDAPSTLTAVESSETGPYVGLETRVGLFALAFEYSPAMEKSNGSIGIALGGTEPAGASAPLSLDLGFVVGNSVGQSVRLAALLHGERKELHEEAYAAFSQGYYAGQTEPATATMFSEYCLGGAIALPVADDTVRFQVGAGPFIAIEQLSTNDLPSSQTLSRCGYLGIVADAGISVALPFKHVPLGIGWRVRWRALQTRFIQTGQSFPARGPVTFEIFASSQS